jgi:predicted nucleic acid-binding protein
VSAYLLDTNHASPLVTLEHPLRQRVLKRLEAGDTFAICVPVVAETLFGIGVLPRAAQNRAEWGRLLPSLPCYFPDEADAVSAAEWQINAPRQGRQLETVTRSSPSSPCGMV